jgi:hypothetical protein
MTLVALSLGGSDIPYNLPGFYLTLTFGVLSIIGLGLWEWKGAKEPFFARSLFTGRAKQVLSHLTIFVVIIRLLIELTGKIGALPFRIIVYLWNDHVLLDGSLATAGPGYVLYGS